MKKIGTAFATAGIAASLYIGAICLDNEMHATPRYINNMLQTRSEIFCEKIEYLGGFYLSLWGVVGSSVGLCYFLKEED